MSKTQTFQETPHALLTPEEIYVNQRKGFAAANVQMWRKKHGLTKVAFAESLGVSPQVISRIESGERDFSVDLMLKICYKMKIDPEELFSQSGVC